jgi:hypothetical protein
VEALYFDVTLEVISRIFWLGNVSLKSYGNPAFFLCGTGV